MIEFSCNCGQLLSTDEANRGRTIACPGCGKQQSVPYGTSHVTTNRAAGGSSRPQKDESYRQRGFDDYSEPAPQGPASTSGKAIASLLLGFTSCTVLTGLLALILGFMALGDIGRSGGRLKGSALATIGIIFGIIGMLGGVIILPLALLIPAVQKVREAAARMTSSNNLKQQILAMHNYESSMGRLPFEYNLIDSQPGGSKQGPSWRVAILPYIEEEPLYMTCDEKQPWDSPRNQSLQSSTVRTYQLTPGDTSTSPTNTYYQVFVTVQGKQPHAMFDDPMGHPGPVRMAMVTDGTANTIMIAEGATPVPWYKPQDIPFDPDLPPPPLANHWNGGNQVGMADGSTHFLQKNTNPATLKGLITRDGGEVPVLLE